MLFDWKKGLCQRQFCLKSLGLKRWIRYPDQRVAFSEKTDAPEDSHDAIYNMQPNRPCDCCGEGSLKSIEFPNAHRLWYCSTCKLYQQGIPTQEDIYEHDYHVEYSRHLAHKTRTATVRLDTIHRRLAGNHQYRLLDIGCSVGATLAAGKNRGWNATGADVSQQAVDWCKGRGFDAHAMPDGKLPFECDAFDVVTAWHVIEHVSDVNETLNEWLRVLKPGGLLALETPHAGCLKVRLLGNSYKKFWISDHLYAFRPGNLRTIVERHGMELVPVPIFGRSIGSPLSWIYSWVYQGFKEPLRRMGIAKAFQIMARKPLGPNQ